MSEPVLYRWSIKRLARVNHLVTAEGPIRRMALCGARSSDRSGHVGWFVGWDSLPNCPRCQSKFDKLPEGSATIEGDE